MYHRSSSPISDQENNDLTSYTNIIQDYNSEENNKMVNYFEHIFL